MVFTLVNHMLLFFFHRTLWCEHSIEELLSNVSKTCCKTTSQQLNYDIRYSVYKFPFSRRKNIKPYLYTLKVLLLIVIQDMFA